MRCAGYPGSLFLPGREQAHEEQAAAAVMSQVPLGSCRRKRPHLTRVCNVRVLLGSGPVPADCDQTHPRARTRMHLSLAHFSLASHTAPVQVKRKVRRSEEETKLRAELKPEKDAEKIHRLGPTKLSRMFPPPLRGRIGL